MEHPSYPGFCAVPSSFDEWLNNMHPERDGERVLWADGSAHGFPEFPVEQITVLRRVENCDPIQGKT